MKINYTAKENLIFLPDREWVLFGVRLLGELLKYPQNEL